MNCPQCGNGIEMGWHYCPNCGLSFRKQSFSNIFKKVFNDVKREMGVTDRTMEKDIEALDLSPFFENFNKGMEKPTRRIMLPKNRSGFSVRITSGTGRPPKVSVRTFGNVDRENIENQLKKQLGMRQLQVANQHAKTVQSKPQGMVFKEHKTTEEPKENIKRTANGLIVELDMPGVNSENDIEIKELENSVEVKAVAGDKAYFKILTKPEKFHLKGKSFENGKLLLKFA
ncbi:MAG: hypothetical protein ISS36_02485 [Candidatus Aenigmarchaeota archaeon]|nr:hypothetical protein [Candidatus Aenigmarchaeota archaeon]